MKKISLVLATAAALAAGGVSAQSFSVRAGIANFNPQSDTGTIAGLNSSIDDSNRFVVGASYFLDDSWEFAFDTGATTFKHSVNLAGLGNAVSLKHHPINLGINWHFLGADSSSGFSPYVGAGYNWTSLSDTNGIGALAGVPIEIDDSSGFTATLGTDFNITDQFYLRGEARYIDFSSEVFAGGANVGTASVDPWVFTFAGGYRF